VATQLNQVLTFINVAPAAIVALPHNINVSDVPVKPDFVFRDNGDFTVISCTTTVLTVQNTSAGIATLNAWLWHQHTIDRVYGDNVVVDLNPQPFVPASSFTVVVPAPVSALPEQWAQDNVAANQTNIALFAQVSTNFDSIKMMRAGSVVGLSTRLTEAITAGSLTVKLTKNGVAGTLQVVHTSGGNPSGGQTVQAAGIDTYVAGDLIAVQLTTNAGFLPITTDLEAWLEISETI